MTLTKAHIVKTEDQFINFFVRHPKLFIIYISSGYPLNKDLLNHYADRWDWERLSHNKLLPWERNPYRALCRAMGLEMVEP